MSARNETQANSLKYLLSTFPAGPLTSCKCSFDLKITGFSIFRIQILILKSEQELGLTFNLEILTVPTLALFWAQQPTRAAMGL